MVKRLSYLILIIAANINLLFACTNIIVTKGASTDGSVFITYSADSYQFYGDLVHYKRAIYPEGTMLSVYEWDSGKFLGKIKQAKETYNVVGNMNEFQVVIGETTFGGPEELINPKGIIDYGSLIYITLQRAKTARDAIKIMAELVDEYGYCSSGESFSIADAKEAWIMEMVGKGEGKKGAVWVAIRIPDGYISAHANMARITTFNLKDPENVLYSKDVISFAREKGYFNGKDEEFSFADAYAPMDFGSVRFCDGRVWSVFRRVNKSAEKYISYIKGESLERMPLFIKPERKLSLQDVMALMRDHYEGTEFDMTKGIAAGTYNSPYRWRPLTWEFEGNTYFHERPISTPQTGFSFVSQARDYLPNEIGGILWFGVDDTYMTVYTPMYCSITKAPHNFGTGLASLSHFNWESAFWVFNFVSNFAYPKYSLIIDDIISEQRNIEGYFLAQQPSIEKQALAYHKESPAKCVEFLTEYSEQMGAYTYNKWKKLGEFLLVKYLDGVVKNEYFKPVNVGYPKEFKARIVAEAGDKIKLKKLPTEIEREYNNHLKLAEENLKQKNYSVAINHYKKALELKPDKTDIKEKLSKIEKIQADIEKLHKELLE